MKLTASTLVLSALLSSSLVFSPAVAADESAELERKIEEARKQLDEAARTLAELHKKQYAGGGGSKKAMLGILLEDTHEDGGIDLAGISPGGGAEAAGLKAGDKIVSIGGQSLAEVDDPMMALVKYMKNITPGESVALVYERNGATADATVVTQAQSSHMMKIITNSGDMDFDFDFDGISAIKHGDMKHIMKHVHNIETEEGQVSSQLLYVSGDLAKYFDVDEGVVLMSAQNGSKLRAGDVLLNVAGQDIGNVDAAVSALQELSDDAVDAVIQRRGKKRNLDLTSADYDASDSQSVKVIRIKSGDDGTEESDIRIEVRD